MEQHKELWISGRAVPGPPYTDYWTPGGAVLFQRDNGSVVELVRFNLQTLELDDEGVAALFGVELARLVVDTSYPELVRERHQDEQLTNKQSAKAALTYQRKR